MDGEFKKITKNTEIKMKNKRGKEANSMAYLNDQFA